MSEADSPLCLFRFIGKHLQLLVKLPHLRVLLRQGNQDLQLKFVVHSVQVDPPLPVIGPL